MSNKKIIIAISLLILLILGLIGFNYFISIEDVEEKYTLDSINVENNDIEDNTNYVKNDINKEEDDFTKETINEINEYLSSTEKVPVFSNDNDIEFDEDGNIIYNYNDNDFYAGMGLSPEEAKEYEEGLLQHYTREQIENMKKGEGLDLMWVDYTEDENGFYTYNGSKASKEIPWFVEQKINLDKNSIKYLIGQEVDLTNIELVEEKTHPYITNYDVDNDGEWRWRCYKIYNTLDTKDNTMKGEIGVDVTNGELKCYYGGIAFGDIDYHPLSYVWQSETGDNFDENSKFWAPSMSGDEISELISKYVNLSLYTINNVYVWKDTDGEKYLKYVFTSNETGEKIDTFILIDYRGNAIYQVKNGVWSETIDAFLE